MDSSVAVDVPHAIVIGKTLWDPFEQLRIDRKDGPPLDIYFAGNRLQKKPLVISIQGSHCLPLLMIGEKGGRQRKVSTALFNEFSPSQLERAHFVMVERRGLKSFGPLPTSEEDAKAKSHCTQEHGGLSKAERVKDIADVARALAQESFVQSIWVIGHSEGAYVASGVAGLLGDRIGAVGLLSGPGPTQFFDWLLEARRDHDLQAAKQVFDDIIWLTSGTASGEYRGAGIQRQITYGIDSTPIDDLRKSHVPIFVAQGMDDSKSPIESTDLFVAEMLRDPKRRIKYLILPGLDHGYHDAKNDRDYSSEVLDAFLGWAGSGANGRFVAVGLPSQSANPQQKQ